MCGITGIVHFSGASTKLHLSSMIKAMEHRGPDSQGEEHYECQGVSIGFGHARLSIIDLSPSGHQPMNYDHLSLVFNGEIYNYQEIKKELIGLGHEFKGGSDTEVILHAYDQWGVKAVDRFIGMFAFVLLDKKLGKMYFFRDRAGVKPLYVYQQKGSILFGSELKTLVAHPEFEKEIAPEVLNEYLHHGYVPGPYSIFRNCLKVLPGQYWELDLSSQNIEKEFYWQAKDYYQAAPSTLSYEEARVHLHELITSASNYRMVADVPVGVFLSGGFDSSLVTSLLQSGRTDRLKTFTIGFNEGNNEAPVAREIADHLGTDHHELICTTKQAQEIIPELPFYYDEPFGDSSAIPTILVSQMARQNVTVALSADAGDETFFGYSDYFKWAGYFEKARKSPAFMRSFLSRLMKEPQWTNNQAKSVRNHQIHGLLNALDKDEYKMAATLFRGMNEKPSDYLSKYLKPGITAVGSPYSIPTDGFRDPYDIPPFIDYNSYLPDDILTKVDRATMSVSLEGREPLLDHRIFEFAASLPNSFKYRNGGGKAILKDIVYDYLPKSLMDRPKSGFTLPIYTWLRGDLKYLLEDYMSPKALKASGLLDEDFITGELEKFKANTLYYNPVIWYILMFQMWYKKWMD